MKAMQVLTIFLLIAAGITVVYLLPPPEILPRDIDTSWVIVAQELGINNLVSAVYLGPRIIDTLVEVMVVVLTVFGMKYIREDA